MKDAVTMWREPRMVVLVAVCAAVYTAALLPFKVLVIFPGLAEVRPAAVLPVLFSLFFGPAGAWGAAFGNVVGDMLGGMFGPGSLFGFAANFVYGYVPYKMWEAMTGGKDVGEELRGWRGRIPARLVDKKVIGLILAGLFVLGAVGAYLANGAGIISVEDFFKWGTGEEKVGLGLAGSIILIAIIFTLAGGSVLFIVFSPLKLVLVIFVASTALAGILGYGIELLGFVPFRVFGPWVLANNLLVSVILAPSLILLLHKRVADRYMLYSDLLPERSPGIAPRWGMAILVLSVMSLFGLGVAISPEEAGNLFDSESGLLLKAAGLSPLVLLIFVGLALL